MASLEIALIKNYLEKVIQDVEYYSYRSEAMQMSYEIAVHAFGLFPDCLIKERRPNEPEAVYNYRCQIYQPITKKYIGKVITELNKIRRSSDWSIIFDKNAIPAKLLENTLENYITYNIPTFTSITNWLFSLALPTYLIDANAFIVVIPESIPVSVNDLINPVPEIIPIGRVMYYDPKKAFIYKSEEVCEYWAYDEDGNKYLRPGDVVYMITPTAFARYDQASEDYRLKEVFNWQHNLGYLPVTQTGGLVKGKKDNKIIYRSRISDMIPDLNEAAREYSDMQAEKVNNIYSERWEIAPDECPSCAGSGEIIGAGFAQGTCEPCKKCNGTGHIPRSPYSKIVLKKDILGDNNFPIPPAGYVEKDTSILEIQDKGIRQHIIDALGAVNMNFLEDVPLSESGEAKKVDRDALNTFVHSIAEDLVKIADDVVKFINDMRYIVLVPDADARKDMLPYIVVPESFDLLGADYLLKELSDAQSSNVSPVIIKALEREYTAKKFNANPEIRQELELTLTLDPLSGITDEDKLTRLSARGITQQSYIISSNITAFISRALFEYKDDFYTMEMDKQKEILVGYANEVMQAQNQNLVGAV